MGPRCFCTSLIEILKTILYRMINMKYRLGLLLIIFISASLFARTRPNIIFIITDDQSWDSIGFTGGDVYTPRLDKMAQEGIFLSDFNVTTTVCSPSRYS